MSQVVKLSGTTLNQLDYAFKEFFHPGQRVELIAGVEKELSGSDVASIEAYLRSKGLDAQVDFGSTKEWTNAVRIMFTRPGKTSGVGFIPLLLPPAALIIGALGLVGVTGIIGFRLSQVVEQIAKNIVPLALIGGGIFLGIALLNKSKAGA